MDDKLWGIAGKLECATCEMKIGLSLILNLLEENRPVEAWEADAIGFTASALQEYRRQVQQATDQLYEVARKQRKAGLA